jgi:hypothetical protein
MVFTAHIPHEQNAYHQTWFGYWKNDGFIKTKHKGRIDGGNWKETEENWLSAYFGRKEVTGFSVLQKVGANDEWCAEAYMETDYSALTEKDLMKFTKDYILFKIKEN